MERNQAISVAVGVGAVGTAIAYLAYSYSGNEDDTSNIVETDKDNNSWWDNLWVNSNNEKEEEEVIEKVYDASNVKKSDTQKTDAQKTETEKSNTKSTWGQFWKDEYNDKKNEKVNICKDDE